MYRERSAVRPVRIALRHDPWYTYTFFFLPQRHDTYLTHSPPPPVLQTRAPKRRRKDGGGGGGDEDKSAAAAATTVPMHVFHRVGTVGSVSELRTQDGQAALRVSAPPPHVTPPPRKPDYYVCAPPSKHALAFETCFRRKFLRPSSCGALSHQNRLVVISSPAW